MHPNWYALIHSGAAENDAAKNVCTIHEKFFITFNNAAVYLKWKK